MKTYRRRLTTAVLAVAMLAGLPAGVAQADYKKGTNNLVTVKNFRPNATLEKSRVGVAEQSGSVYNRNIADARSSCTDCRTVAVATQVVVLEGPAGDFQPFNLAVALNEECVRCQTFAFARQTVIKSPGEVQIGDSAENRIDELADRIDNVSKSDLAFADMASQLDSLFNELVAVVQAEVNTNGMDSERTDRRRVERDDD